MLGITVSDLCFLPAQEAQAKKGVKETLAKCPEDIRESSTVMCTEPASSACHPAASNWVLLETSPEEKPLPLPFTKAV